MVFLHVRREINRNLFKLEGSDPLIVCTQIYFQLISRQVFWFIPAVLCNSRRSTGLPPLHGTAVCAWFSVNHGHVSQIRERDLPCSLWTWDCVAGRERGQAVGKGSISPFSVSSLSQSIPPTISQCRLSKGQRVSKVWTAQGLHCQSGNCCKIGLII